MLKIEDADRSFETAYNRLIARLRIETDKRPICLPGTPELIDELIAQFERVEKQYKALRAATSECLAVMNIMSIHAQTIRIVQSQACADWPRNEESTDRIKASADKAWREFNEAHKTVAEKYEDD